MCKWKFDQSSIKHHKLKRRVELKILKILKNHFGQFHKMNNDNQQLHTLAIVFQTYVQFYFYYHVHEYYILVLNVILNLSNSYILLSSANYDVLASYTIS